MGWQRGRVAVACRISVLSISVLLGPAGCGPAGCEAGQPDPPGQVTRGTPRFAAYLFAHMLEGDYGRLYYSVSVDGLNWKLLNQGRRVFEDYRGHADICLGHDGRYYLVGNRSDSSPDINFWVSEDLIGWQRYGDYVPRLQDTPGYAQALPRIGAPKLFFDQQSSRYLLTWHTPHQHGTPEDPERYWASQRTLYVTSADLQEFAGPPQRLFDWDMATIDVIVRREGERYFAIIKDERYPTLDWTTGKTIRIASSPGLLGPYASPGPSISPNFREAPTLIPSPNGQAWYLYYEQYPGVAYGVSVAAHLAGTWYQLSGNTSQPSWNKYSLPGRVRHGSMISISRSQHDELVKHFPAEPQQPAD